MKRKITVFCLVVTAIIALGFFLLNFVRFEGIRNIRKAEESMRNPKVYEPVGKTLALYCQSDRSLFPEDMNYAWIPELLNRIGHGRLTLEKNGAYVEMGGGFYHFGYNLDLDVAHSLSGTNVWQLSIYGEENSQHLSSIVLPAQAKLSADDLLQRVEAAFDEQIRKNSKDDEAYKGKIQTYLRFGRVFEARQACKDMRKAMPDDWWATLVNALVITEEQSSERGTEVMLQWVQKNENFFRYLDLAYYYQLTNRPREAAKAIIKSTEFTADTSWGDGGNSEFRGYAAAMTAYHAGDYEASLKLCAHLLPVKINGDYAKHALRELKTASERAINGKIDNIPWAKEILPFDAFDGMDIKKLLGREVSSGNS